MKYGVALLVAASIVSFSPVQADAVADLAKANCSKALVNSAAIITRSDLKSFQFNKTGSGYEMSGFDEARHPVSCEAAADGHVLWIHGG